MLAAAGAASVLSAVPSAGAQASARRLGVCSISYALRWPAVNRGRSSVDEMLEFVSHCQQLGAGGVQTSIPVDDEFVAALRRKLEQAGMYLEGQIALPHTEGEVARFEAEVQAAKEAGATVLRTACLSGRRYETFHDPDAFAEFAAQAERALTTAEPIVAKHRMRLAVENHKDWRVPELVRLLKRLSSEYVGVCIDTGNSIALLEDPSAVVEAYAPYALATHLKDMAVQEYEQGFLLTEVPLGDGFLDLKSMVGTLRRARPELQFSLEMIARDPLKVPCLAKAYWATFENTPGWFLASTLTMVRNHAAKDPLPHVSDLTAQEKLQAEDRMVQRSLAYAKKELNL